MSKPKKKIYPSETITLPDLIPAQPARRRGNSHPSSGRTGQGHPPDREVDDNLNGEEIIHRLIDYFTKAD